MHEIFVQETAKGIRENFEIVEDSTKLETKLNQLSNLVKEDSNKDFSGSAWRPSNSAIDNQAAHDRVNVENSISTLEKDILNPLQNDVAILEKNISELSYQIAENAGKINQILQE